MVKILVAEDDRALNELVCSILIGSGYEAVSCLDGGRGIAPFGRRNV